MHAAVGFVQFPGVNGHCERLSATDLVFLELEDANVSMHIGALCIFEGRALLGRDGGLDMRRMRGFVAAALASNSRFRQRLAYVPVLEHPMWVDDAGFDLRYSGEEEIAIRAGNVADVPSSIAIQWPPGVWGLLIGRSSTFRQRGLLVNPAVIDPGFRGAIGGAAGSEERCGQCQRGGQSPE